MDDDKKWTFKQHYDKDRPSFNAKRRAAYAARPDLREAARARAAKARAKGIRSAGRELVLDGITVYSLGYVANLVDMPISRLRYMERTGLLPKPTVARPQRFYTEAQKDYMVRYLQGDILLEELHQAWN